MKYEEIMKLLDNGFSREEILEVMKSQQDPEPQQDPDPQQDPEIQQDPEPQQDLEKINETITGVLGEIKTAFDGFKKEMVAMNIMNSNIDGKSLESEDILANIINPFEDK